MRCVLLILWKVIAPIFLLMGAGYFVEKRLGFDLRSLTRLNFWIFVPAFLFVKIVETELSPRELGVVAAHFFLLFGAMGVLTWYSARLIGAQDSLRRAITTSVLFYNSGNYGVPAAQLAFPNQGVAESVQAITMTLQNFTNFSIGLGLVAGGQGKSRRETLQAMFRLPMIYTFIVAVIWRVFQLPKIEPVWEALQYLSDGLVPVALITLGAQMGQLKSYKFRREMALSLFLRLALAPILGFVLIKVVGAQGLLAQSILVSTSFPTAVNSALLAIEYNNEPEFASAIVFYSTLISSVTVSLVIFAAKHWI
jgi:malate permease and related proteins